jgi:Heterokaryon incompatibility protein (HET)
VNSCVVEVTRNLHAALVRLRLENKKCRLWVDAVFINQNDDTEKSDQVNMMREIYQHGTRTLVLLGSDSMALTKGFLVIAKMLKGIKFYEERDGLEPSQGLDSIPSVHTYNRPGLLAIFEQPYFTRIWVIQEVAVSSSAEAFCGHHSISWDGLAAAGERCNTAGTEPFDEMQSLALFENISGSRTRIQAGIKQDLPRLLIEHRGAATTCTKDKVYALLGMLDPEDLQSHCIVPNYRKEYTTEEVYIDVAISIITTTKNLDMSSGSGILTSGPKSLQLPTWAPDWSRPSSTYTLIWSSDGPSFAATDCRPVAQNAEEWLDDRKQWEDLFGRSKGPSGFLDRSGMYLDRLSITIGGVSKI